MNHGVPGCRKFDEHGGEKSPASRLLHGAVLWVCAATICLAGAEPVRVVSQTVGTDEMLLALAEPEQIAALSQISREASFSGVAKEAESYPQLERNGDVENVLRYRPTLVLVMDFSRAELVAQVRRMGVKVLVIDRYQTLEDDYASLRLLARELGPAAEKRAEAIVADCERRVATLRERLRGVKPVRVISPSTYGVIPGDGTTFEDFCAHAGAENLATTLGHLHGHASPPDEQMLTWPIDRVVLAGESDASALAPFKALPPYQFMAAVKEGRVARLESWQFSCVTHLRVQAYEQLARALHPEAFK